MRVAVVGAGVIGLSVAVELAERGASVVVLEADHVGAGTSSTSFAWVNSHRKRPEVYHALNVEGMRAHRARSGPWFFASGHLEIARSAADAVDVQDELAELGALGYEGHAVTVEEARRLEPALRIEDDVAALVHYPAEGYCHVQVWLGHLRARLAFLGGEVREGFAVQGADASSAGIRARLADGSSLDVDVVVSAVGRCTQSLSRRLDGPIVPMAGTDGSDVGTNGLLAITAPSPVPLRGVVSASGVNLRPEGNGRLMVQIPALDPAADSDEDEQSLTAALSDEFARRTGEVLRWPRRPRIERVLRGRRAIPADGQPVTGWTVPDRVYVVATHSGVTLAPALAPLVAQEVLAHPQSELSTFRPDRFVDGGVHDPAAEKSSRR